MRKKHFIIIAVLAFVFVVLVIGWGIYVKNNSVNGGSVTITANEISNTPEEIEKSFTYGEYKFVYYNVYNKNGQFVILDGGYIYSTNGNPLSYFIIKLGASLTKYLP